MLLPIKEGSHAHIVVYHAHPAISAIVLLLCLYKCAPAAAQAEPSAIAPSFRLQIGAQIPWANSDYSAKSIAGYGFYADYHLAHHLSIEGDFRQLDTFGAKAPIYERTFELGPQYSFGSGPLRPYLKAMIGRGVFNFPPSPQNPRGGAVANLAYDLVAPGGGVEWRFRNSISFRIDHEYQQWIGFPPHGLTPQVVSFGVAWRLH